MPAGSIPDSIASEWAVFRSTPYLPAYGEVQAYQKVSMEEGSRPAPMVFSLDPGKSLSGVVLDPEGRPMTGAEVYGESPQGRWSSHASQCRVHGVRASARAARSLAKLLESRSPEGLATFVQAESPRTLVFVQSEKHLGAASAGPLHGSGTSPGPAPADGHGDWPLRPVRRPAPR